VIYVSPVAYSLDHDIYRVPVASVVKPAHLRLDDVAAIGGVQPRTVSQHLHESRPAGVVERGKNAGRPRPAGKYVDDPFPTPDHHIGTAAVWLVEQESDIRAWFERHPRREVGDGIGGRPRREK
jgi:hypothetical protein